MKSTAILQGSIIVVLVIVAISGLLYQVFHINTMSWLPEQSICPIYNLTDHQCPGCGMTRAFLHLGQLKMREAFQSNIFAIPLVMLMMAYLFWRKRLEKLNHPLVGVVLCIMMIMYWIYRF